ncbi:hypothetical protein EXIGLDRAFT_839343 [Exidia glandulosa HHB12029]|uniref:Voltage-gated hydrogen channel 1 n=1 Tax=Exidia glandulosa HHB12029 TaxID=1314781 RepID=A0A165F3M3_EXIGL|nr:hypothetical protein EXIGLDRAFT_839343 [Exidia glandulosa HHB12029]
MSTPPTEQDPLLPTSSNGHDDDAAGPPRSHRRQSLARRLDSNAMHWTVLGLVFVDIAIVVADLSYTFLTERCPPKTGPSPLWLYILQNVSKVITGLFVAEIPLEIYAYGWHFYNPLKFPLHAFDLLVIVATFVFEMVLSGKEQEIAGLVVLLRLWRLVRLAGGVALGVGKWEEDELSELRLELSEKRKELESTQQELQQLRQRLGAPGDDV